MYIPFLGLNPSSDNGHDGTHVMAEKISFDLFEEVLSKRLPSISIPMYKVANPYCKGLATRSTIDLIV